ncbi:NUDIX hydrolase domain-like protein [Trametes elegans]|nr:NUDIX hydrolase domain-like protein [Trametes elegans]
MLSRQLTTLVAKESPANFFAGSPLNRLSWLRTSQPFLNAIIHAPATRWLVFKEGQPLLRSQAGNAKHSLARLPTSDVQPLLGPEPYFSQGQHAGERASDDTPLLQAARLRGAPIVFLGLHETKARTTGALPSSEFSAKTSADAVLANIHGTPYFSLDVSDVAQADVDRVLRESAARDAEPGTELAFSEPRAVMNSFDPFEAALFSEARTMADWNARNRFCPACGSPVYSLWAGWKLACASLLPWADNSGRKPCASARGLHNFTHPRSDPVIIMAVLDETGDRILLGRNARLRFFCLLLKNWPAKFYSCLSGFVEPGESFEDAFKREIWEEAGVSVSNVRYHSTQPWPFPANVMAGFYATANSSQPLRTDLDNELEEARWYAREEVLAVLNHGDAAQVARRDHRDLAAAFADSNANQQSSAMATTTNASAQGAAAVGEHAAADDAPPFKIPPMNALAGVLISRWAYAQLDT